MAGKTGFELVKRAMLKELMKRGDDGIMLTLPKNEIVDLNARITMDRLIRNGYDPDSLTSVDQVLNILDNINNLNTKVLSGDDAARFLNQAFGKKGEVIPFPQKRNFKEEIEAMVKDGTITKGTTSKKSDKVLDREMFKEANERLGNKNQTDIITETITKMTNMEPVTALKEANKIIGRKGIYKNLTAEESQTILKGTDDWIHQRDLSDRWDYKKNRPFRDDPDFDPDDPDYLQRMKDEDAPDFAKGGRAGFYDGGYGKEAYNYLKEIDTDMHKGYQYYKRHGGKKSFSDYVRSAMEKYFADGGRAGYYGGGLTEIEPSLSDIGHGSDALMARTRLLSPNNQATTSTGLNYLLAEDNDNLRVPFRYGKSVEDNPMKRAQEKIKRDNLLQQLMMLRKFTMFGEPMNFPYKSLEDIPKEVLEMLMKDPNFDLETFLTKVAWSDPDKTRVQTKLKGDDEAWGLYSPMSDMSFLNYQQFGKSEPIGDGLLSIKSPSDSDKVQTILHEMRHGKMKEPWFMQSSAVPDWVRKYEMAGGPHYLDADIEDEFAKYRGDQQQVSGEELYVRFLDQKYGDVAEKGTIAGSDYKPYFDKILKDHWEPYAKRYEEILNEEKRVKNKPYGLAEGGRIGFAGGTDLRRRAFLKLMAALTGGVAAVKSGILSLSGKGAATKKTIPLIKTDNVAGKPEWFDALVNKVITQGDDVTKNFQTKERQIVHKKKLNDDETAMVTQDLDEGSITVELESPKNVYGDKVQLRYTKPNPDEGNPRPTAEFDVAESGPVGRADGPDDYSIEIDEIGGTSIKDLDSDVSVLKEYATGKKPNMKEILQNMKRKDKAARISEGGEGEMDAVIRRQGEFIENDLVDLDPPDYAEGGRIGRWMGGGFSAGKRTLSELLKFMAKDASHGKKPSEILQMVNPKQFNKILNDPAMAGKSSPEHPEGIASLVKNYIKQMQDERVTMIDDLIGTGKRLKKTDDDIVKYKEVVIEDMMSKGIDKETSEQMAEVISNMAAAPLKKYKDAPKLTDQGLLELENIQKNLLTKDRKVNANGGLQTMLGE